MQDEMQRQQRNVAYQAFLDTIPCGALENDPSGRITFCNQAYLAMLGYAEGELIGKSTWDLLPSDADKTELQNYLSLLYEKQPTPTPFVTKNKTKDGGIIDIEMRWDYIRDSSGRFLGFISFVFDITSRKLAQEERTAELLKLNEQLRQEIEERKRAEEAMLDSQVKYRALVKDSRDAIYMVSRDGTFLDVNKAAVDLFGYTSEEIIGMNVLSFYVNPVDRHRFQEEIERHGAVRDYEVRLRKKEGREMVCLATSTLRRDADGEILGYQGILRDITEKRKIEAEMLKIEKLESISILAGGIAHDFNNILTAILGNFALAKAQSKPGDIVFDRLAAAEKAALRANDLTRQFLIFAQGGSPIKARFSVADLLRDSAKLTLRRKNVRCEFSIADDLWPVEGDGSQISQVIHNLLINADQAMPKGGTITIKAENINVGPHDLYPLKKGRYVKITVEDEGIGIPPQNLKKIFDPYFTTKEMGSGLGLAVTYSVVKKHGGYIDVDSTPGRGSRFSLYLPVTEAEPSVWERRTSL